MDTCRLVYIAVARTVSCHPTSSPDLYSHTRSSEAYVGRNTGGINMNICILLLACVFIGSNATKVHNTGGYVSGRGIQYPATTLLASPAVVQGVGTPVYTGSTQYTGGIGIGNSVYTGNSLSYPTGNIASSIAGPSINAAFGSDLFNSAIGSGQVIQGYQTPIITAQSSLGSYITPNIYNSGGMPTYNVGLTSNPGLYSSAIPSYNVGIGGNSGVYNTGIGASYLLNTPTGTRGSYPHPKKAHGGY